jgi:hypothetical protein
MEKIQCEYCNKLITKAQKTRHERSKLCENNKIKHEHKCKYCEKIFYRSDVKNEHENNMSCNTKDIYIKYQIELEKNKQKDELLKQKDEEILYLKNQIDKIQPNNNQPNNNQTNNNQTYNNCNFVYVNINCPDDIITALPNLTIEHEMQGGYGIGLFLMDYVLKGKILIHDIPRKLMSYMLNDEVVKDNGTKIILKVLNPIDKEINQRMFKNKYNEIQKEMILSNMANVPLIVNKHKGYDDTEIFNGIQEAIFKNGKTKK